MTTKISNSELDFDTIKQALKDYLSDQSVLSDYNFNGSALSILLDVLAYNTHQNALISNFMINEAFLDSAQLKSSVISHARSFGYTPRSKRASIAQVNISTLNVQPGTGNLTLPIGTVFTSTIDDEAYSFTNLNEYSTNNSLGYVFNNVSLYQGTLKTKTFYAGDEEYPLYVISDENVDTSTLIVKVKESLNSNSYTTYTRSTNVSNLESDSLVYYLHQSPRGYWEIAFGDDDIGKKPEAGSVIEVTYLATSGSLGNNASTFSTSSRVSNYSLSVITSEPSVGGSEAETLESIRYNAPLARNSQDRLVTVNDFKAFVNSEVPSVEALNIWGGETNIPPNYGHVYISVKPVGSSSLTQAQKTSLAAKIRERSVIDLRPIFIDPTTTYIEVSGNVIYDSSQTSLSSDQVSNAVRSAIVAYGASNLTTFNNTLYKYQLEEYIKNSLSALVSVDLNLLLQKRLNVTLGANDSYSFSSISEVAEPKNTSSGIIFTSAPFTHSVTGISRTVSIRNRPDSRILEMVYSSSGETIIAQSCGSVSASGLEITVGPFQPTDLTDTGYLRLSYNISDDSFIKPLRNNLLQFDSNRLFISSVKV